VVALLGDGNVSDQVLEAFEAALREGRPPVECYRAGVNVWRHFHPDHAPESAAKQAVGIILTARGPDMMRVE
jgi:hypothetical protein